MPEARSVGRVSDPVLPIAVTMGDPAGIGPDITLASWLARKTRALHPFFVYGDLHVLAERARRLRMKIPMVAVASPQEAAGHFDTALPVYDLKGSPGAEDATIVAGIEAAVASVVEGESLALVTNPITKKSMRGIRLEYPGHTAFLGLLAARHHPGREFRPTMMLASDELKVVPVTVHIALSAVPRTLTTPLIVRTLSTTAAALIEDFGISGPRIAVAGLNPHAGEGGLIGTEEIDIIAPAIAEVAARGIAVTGPLSADTLFHPEARSNYDAIVTMYHDQALIPLKTLAFHRGVNVTLGLPFVRTSPDHGTAFPLAGTGHARPDSFIMALQLAAQLARRRAAARTVP